MSSKSPLSIDDLNLLEEMGRWLDAAPVPTEDRIVHYEKGYELMSLTETLQDVYRWANTRNLIKGATSKDQLCKLVQEVGEVSDAICKGDIQNLESEIGDCIVVLKILAAQNGLSITECVNTAFNKIKHRKGIMRDGVFIKEEDLNG